MTDKSLKTDVVVIGSGPGGYSAAFRAADLGKKVVLVEREASLGGVCLNVGCIPSKALLHVAKVMSEAAHLSQHGVAFSAPKIDLAALRQYKDGVIGRLTGGLDGLAKLRQVQVVHGHAGFRGPNTVVVEHAEGGKTTVSFEHAIVAAGSRPVSLPFLPKDERVWDSTAALELRQIPKKLLVIGGGIIGLEMATVYQALGSKVTVVEWMDGIMAGVDRDIVKPYQRMLEQQVDALLLGTKVTAVEAKKSHLHVNFEGQQAPKHAEKYDAILSAVGRLPNGHEIAAQEAGVEVDERGFIAVDGQMRTNVPHIFAIGDIVGDPMLAHKAIPEGRLAAEVIAGADHIFDAKVIPSVAYTDPEVAWVGITEEQAHKQGLAIGVGRFPWAACGRSLAQGRDEGMTKLIFDKASNQVIGGAIVGPSAGDLISEVALAIEMGCDAEDLALTIHPHPTFAETICMAAEVYEGTVTDLPNK